MADLEDALGEAYRSHRPTGGHLSDARWEALACRELSSAERSAAADQNQQQQGQGLGQRCVHRKADYIKKCRLPTDTIRRLI